MATKSVPYLVSGLLPDKFLSSAIARVANAIAATAKGAASGVAPLDSASRLPLANMVSGGVLCVHYNGVAWPGSRPTARTDITVFIDAPEGTTAPTWMLAGDKFETF